ncbi:tyrosine-type recombinase/integrase [Halorussus pelagicus]|uniref:tyrosine-type recombinase/integrase n=1 Tax=Halorussus pelagicus TaxID=2505977 RepID=UPI000FFBBB84|nr:tyrosine-type recombinase/integrase [Halorussus pelagicus]
MARNSPDDGLEPLTPRDAVDLYKQDRERELSDATLQSHGYRLKRFIEWCDKEDIDNLNDVTGRDVQRFKIFRKQKVSDVTLKSNLDTLRVFLRFCVSINGCIDGLDETVNSPSLADPGAKGTDTVPRQKAEQILQYLDKYQYASLQHVLFRVLWETGMRMGAARSIDLQHYHPRDEYIELRHNPDTDTPLKNKRKGERAVAISTRTCRIIDDHIEHHRHDVQDDHRRDPLLTTEFGRITKNTIRLNVYRVTRPCTFNGGDCPHDRDPDECEAMNNMTASKCPSSTAPHSIRHGAITDYLSSDVPADVVSDRMNVGTDIIEERYDHRDSKSKMRQRRERINWL